MRNQQMINFTALESQNEILEALKNGILNVEFTKKDGSLRKLICTLSEDKIPEDKKPKNVGITKNNAVLPDFDMENNSWRSFRWDSIQKIDILA